MKTTEIEAAYRKAVDLVQGDCGKFPQDAFRADTMILGLMDRFLVQERKPIEEMLAAVGGAYGFQQLLAADPALANRLRASFGVDLQSETEM